MKLLVLSSRESYQGKLNIFTEHCRLAGFTVDLIDECPEEPVEFVTKNGYDAFVHRNEHGRLFADGSLKMIQELVKAKFPVLSLDFGYLVHYKTFMLDYYRSDLSSSILNDWAEQPAKVDWNKAPEYVQEFRQEVFQKVARADNSKYSNRVAIWMQWNAKLLRPEVGQMQQASWVNKVAKELKQIGKDVVIKHNAVTHSELYEGTVPYINPDLPIICDREKLRERSPRMIFDKYANWNLIAGCDYHVILCSSVSHLMALTKKPVIAMGQSWFNSLGVFQEEPCWPTDWTRPKVNNGNRERWLNWWLGRQCLMEDVAKLVPAVVGKAKEYFNSL